MAVKIRLQRVGTKKRPFYRVVAVDSRKKRSGEFLEKIGQYQPISNAAQFTVDTDKVSKWMKNGAQPTATVEKLLKKNGLWESVKNA